MRILFALLVCLPLVASFGIHSLATTQRESTALTLTASEETPQHSRRGFLSSLVAAGVLVSLGEEDTAAASQPLNYKLVARDINQLIKRGFRNTKGPTLVRLAWHSSGTYDKMSKTGGSKGGTIRFKEELAHKSNGGLDEAVKWLEPIHRKYAKKGLSYADLYTLAGVVAIRALNGPTIPWSSGRVDEMDPSNVTPDGRLPSADSGAEGADKKDAEHLRTVFNRMGFDTDQEIVALSGAHALGRCNIKNSGYDGFWTASPFSFNNSYFGFLRTFNWVKRDWDGNFQYETQGGNFMMLPTDLVLIQDEKFKEWVDIYALDGTRFFEDFSKAFQKLEELGTEGLFPTDWYG